MPTPTPITFAIAVNNDALFESNFLASPGFRQPHPHQILVQRNFRSAARAYNDAIDRSVNDLIIFCHQDIFFPEAWLGQIQRGLDYLESQDPDWGVAGCGGVTSDGHGR